MQTRAYLIATGWTDDGDVANLATIWHRPSEEQSNSELLLPRERVARDYEDRVADLVFELGRFEEREPDEIVESIARLSVDLISVQVMHSDVEVGTIPLDDGVLLNEKARDLMTSAVLSAISKRRHFLGNHPPEASEYLHGLRLGQTRIGSYVINVIAPLEARPPHQVEVDSSSFARQVTRNLAGALTALSDAANQFGQSNDMKAFDSAVEKGASANMCDALLGFSGVNRSRAFSILIAPAPSDPIPINSPLVHKFDQVAIEAIRQAADYFKENYVLRDQVITGYVKRLDRPRGVEIGDVLITATLSGDIEKNVSVELSALDYLEAIHAHEGKLLVECRGDVHISPRAAKLLEATGFRVIRNGDLF